MVNIVYGKKVAVFFSKLKYSYVRSAGIVH